MTGESRAIERQIFIDASPETVFGFLVDPKLMSQWIGIFHALEPHAGGRFQVEVSPGNIARGTYTEVTRPRRVAFTWGWDSVDPNLALTPPGESLVEIELEQRDGGTLLRLRHSGLPDVTIPVHGERWSLYLDRLQEVARG
ncbi:SRPBCC family protein [Bradyrhizobium sp. Ash2021]|uniref:SRPBCC family protein n=1 Tax=Bradyrhizobium sp. Ash2021 TaxID=2954771 RepID=UPI00281629AD|nr:SRPBCC family protein [Bradyrhizobium sp. Ash2021]WMT74377.1 SRPBCC domain-containing protein [Bradyrhizobium sp. Ash2021]